MTTTEQPTIERIMGATAEIKSRIQANMKGLNRATWELIIMVTSEQFGVTPVELMGRRRPQEVADARQTAMAQTRKRIRMSTPRIGQMFDRDHGTILHAIAAVQSKRETDPRFRAKVEAVERELDRVLNGQA